MNTFTCSMCGAVKPVQKEGGTGYAKDDQGNFICYDCCAKVDAKWMDEHDKVMLYLTESDLGYSVSNWPGTLKFQPWRARIGKHNIARTRTDVWFNHNGHTWHGVNYGENTQILHCRKLKG